MGLPLSWLSLRRRRTRSERPRDRTAREAVNHSAVGSERSDEQWRRGPGLRHRLCACGLVRILCSAAATDAPPLTAEHGHGLALGLLPGNTLYNIVHLLFGVMGIAASSGAMVSARGYFRLVAVAYALLVVLGLLPATHTTFGLIPIWGNDVSLCWPRARRISEWLRRRPLAFGCDRP